MAADNRTRLLYLLKSRGPLSTAELARRLGVTTVGARQHLVKLQADGLVHHADRAGTVGRPKRVWSLMAAGHARFPDTHGDLTAGLIDGIRRLFGEAGLNRLIDERQTESMSAYRRALRPQRGLEGRVRALARLRTTEGYMAEVARQADGSYLLIENHCPICIAARSCQGFCRSEAEIFRAALGKTVSVERVEHLLSGARRCVYRIAPRTLGGGRLRTPASPR